VFASLHGGGLCSLKANEFDAQEASLGGDPATVYSAADLAAADIVLTTYDVLRADIHHDPSCPLEAGGEADTAAPQRALRGTKRCVVWSVDSLGVFVFGIVHRFVLTR
jgi:hypothetical protein